MKKSLKNWWYYYKWYVICGIILLVSVIDVAGNKFGWFKSTPDIQIAYIGDNPLPDDAAASLEQTFALLAEDYNEDGKVLVKINQFVSGVSVGGIEGLSYQQAAEIALIGDIEDCTSYFFLMEHPNDVQREFQVLAMPDGSCPPEDDLSAEDKVIPWDTQLPTDSLPADDSTALWDTQLYLGRRCFYNEKRTPYADACSQLWDNIQQGGLMQNEP